MPTVETAFSALRVEGGLLPPAFLQHIAAMNAPAQKPEDYAIPPGRTVRDEIGRYWTIAEALWKDYRQNRVRTDISAERTCIDRFLLRLLRDVLGYVDIAPSPARAVIGERTFPITHRACNGVMPLLLTIADRDLDRSHIAFGEPGRRRAPHAALQEYLNADPTALWGILANGARLRLLRDNPSLTRPAYIEADLERIFEEGLYADFAAFWLLAHASRLAPGPNGIAGGRVEIWRDESAKTGQRALDRLRTGVTVALRELGSGFVEHPDNGGLRTALQAGTLSADGLHQQLLRLIYRLLFLFAAEERDLLHGPDSDPTARVLYARGYSLARLRERARLRRHYDRYGDLWDGLTVTFSGLARGAAPLALPALGGLFEEDQCPDLDTASLPNARLLTAIHALAFFTTDGSLQRVNYRDMGTEELGSVYEGLLELHPLVQVAAQPWTFGFVGDANDGNVARGHERRLSGSYYTPDSLVQELLRSALDPVIEQTIRDNSNNPRNALLRLKVLDPACGSGHFLLGAARRLADALARLDSEGDLPDEAQRRHALREAVRRCIFGVDRNPLSVELCKAALWIETIEPGKPLTFLDTHIKCGDSLIGVTDLGVLKAGIPDEAFKDLTSDDSAYARDLRRRNSAEREHPTLSLLPEVALPADLADAITMLTEAPEDTLGDVAAKRARLRELQTGTLGWDLSVACDLWCAAFFAPKAKRPEFRGRDLVPTTDTVWRYLKAASSVYGPMIGVVDALRGRLRFFHWPLEFPEAWAAGGFDCVLGNPPWERIKLQEQEFFATRHAAITSAPNAAARRRLINALVMGDESEQALHRTFEDAKRDAEAASQFVRGSGRFPLTAVGDVNTYALFAELFLRLPGRRGRAGMIVPTGIATDDGTKAFFETLGSEGRLVSLFSFENEAMVFPGVHHSFKFALMTLGRAAEGAQFVFFARRADALTDTRRLFTLSAADIRLINPNTRTCPVFRSSADAELTKRIYVRVPVLIDERRGAEGNPWGIEFMRMLDMSNDSHLFRTAAQLTEAGAQRDGANWVVPDGSVMVPLYEAKMVDLYDHRAASYASRGDQRGFRVLPPSTEAEHADPQFQVTPFYWVPRDEVELRLGVGHAHNWLIGFKDITSAISERTFIPSTIPLSGVGNNLPVMLPDKLIAPNQVAALVASMSSLVFDHFARQKVGGLHLNFFIVKQLPVLPPSTYAAPIIAFLLLRILELTYTAHDMRPWAEDLGYTGPPFTWDEDRRAHLRAELDAAYAHLYGLTRDELRYILDPADIYGSDFPSETFRVLKEREIRLFGEYRTARLVLAAWDRFTADGTFTNWAAQQPAGPHVQPAPAPETLPDNAWVRPGLDHRSETGAVLAALLKALPGPVAARVVRRAAVLALEPHRLPPFLTAAEAATWRRLIGAETNPPPPGVAAFVPRTDAAWADAVRHLRGNGYLIEDLSAATWAPGPGLEAIVTAGWPDGRARWALDVASRDSAGAIDAALPDDLRNWINAAAA